MPASRPCYIASSHCCCHRCHLHHAVTITAPSPIVTTITSHRGGRHRRRAKSSQPCSMLMLAFLAVVLLLSSCTTAAGATTITSQLRVHSIITTTRNSNNRRRRIPRFMTMRQSNNIQRCPVLFRTHPPNDASLPLPSQSPTPTPVAVVPLPNITSPSPDPSNSDSGNALPSFPPFPRPVTTITTSSVRDNAATPRVVGGASVSRGLRPYIAVLRFTINDKTGVCSATLISPTLLITAAHCVLVETPSDLRIYLGASRGNPPNGAFRTASSIEPHPLFNTENANTAEYDIAYIRLSAPAPASSLFMHVNTNASVPVLGSVVRNVGYGLFDPDDLDSNGRFVPHQVDLPVTSTQFCRRRWLPFGIYIDRQRQVCAGYLKGGCGSCNGDSGGPIFQYDEFDNPVLIGVASIAVQCSTTQVPTVYIRTSAYIRSFIPVDNDVTLTNRTVAYVLPEANRTYPNGQGPASLSSTEGFFQFGVSTWVLIGVGVFALALVLLAIMKWGSFRKRSTRTLQQQQQRQQQPQALEQPVHLGPLLVPQQPVQSGAGGAGGTGGNFVAPDQIISPAAVAPPPPATLDMMSMQQDESGGLQQQQPAINNS